MQFSAFRAVKEDQTLMVVKPSEPARETATDLGPAEGPRAASLAESGHGIAVSEPPTGRPRIWTWLVIALAAVAAWYYRPVWLPWFVRESAAAGASAKKGSRPVPVRTAVAERRDMPL